MTPAPGRGSGRREEAPRRPRGTVEDHWEQRAVALDGDYPDIVCLDLEATGLSSSADHVIEIGAVRFRGGEVLGRYHTLVNPGVRLPPIIRRMTGISDNELAAAPRLQQVLPRLREFIAGARLLAHGAGYDVAFLEDALGVSVADLEVYDSLDVARVLAPGAPSYSLGALCDLVGLSHPRPHRALEDAEATFRLFVELIRMAQQLEPATLAELRRLTVGSRHSMRSFFHELVHDDGLDVPEASLEAGPRHTEAVAERTPLMERLGAVAAADMLGPDSPLASEPGWEMREAQHQMALAVAQAFEREVNLIAEAGTGTGKSLAYLVPALAWAASGGSQVAVSTYTINLQEQLLHKDLPLAARILGVPLRAVLLKGRSHYLSRLRWEQLLLASELTDVAGTPGAPQFDGVDPGELLIFKLKLTIWLTRTRTGDRDELRLFGQEERLWRSVASEWNDCRSATCLDGPKPCFYHLSRQRAVGADVVVVNHALLLADAQSESSSLGAIRNLVLDEAHHLEQAATKGLTDEVREDDLLGAITIARAADRGRPSPNLDGLAAALEGFFDDIRQVAREVFGSELGRELRLEPGRWANAALAIRAALESLHPAAAAVTGPRVSRLLMILEQDDTDHVVWASFGRDGKVSARRAPLDVAPILRELVLDNRDSVVMTSATLAINGSFEYFRRRTGVPASRLNELVLPSPFDFLRQALLCLPDDMPEPAEPEFIQRLVDTVAAVATALHGRTLLLCTSNEQLGLASAGLQQRLGPEGIEVLAQGRGSGSRRSLTERFISVDEAVLCGTNSFWEGLDLPGNALSCVVIARLPFAPPGEPVARARGARLRDPFLELTLPEAVLRLKQGFGRLIRRSTDRGAAIILDSRVSTRTYGEHFINALPECRTHVGPASGLAAAISEWIEDRNISFTDGEPGTDSEAETGPGPVRADAGGRRREPGAPPSPG